MSCCDPSLTEMQTCTAVFMNTQLPSSHNCSICMCTACCLFLEVNCRKAFLPDPTQTPNTYTVLLLLKLSLQLAFNKQLLLQFQERKCDSCESGSKQEHRLLNIIYSSLKSVSGVNNQMKYEWEEIHSWTRFIHTFGTGPSMTPEFIHYLLEERHGCLRL